MTLRRVLLPLAALALLALAVRWLLAPVPRASGDVRPAVETPQVAERLDSSTAAAAPANDARAGLDAPPAASTDAPSAATDLDEPPEVWEGLPEEDLPPDPVEVGPATLALRLVDARSGAPVASRLELWRVDAPGNAGWTAGDQLQRTADVPVEGMRLAGLPEGRYRVVCERALFSQRPPELELRAPHAEVEVALEMPREFELRVRFVDRYGEPFASAEWWEQRAYPVEAAPHLGSYRAPRELQGFVVSEGIPWMGDPGVHALGGPQPESGFALGRARECSRGQRVVRVLRLRAPDGSLAEVDVPARADGDLELVAVGLPPDLAAARVRLPDGRACAARVEALGLARPRAELAGDWRRAPVRITAELAGYAPHSGEWRAEQAELPWILLEPLP